MFGALNEEIFLAINPHGSIEQAQKDRLERYNELLQETKSTTYFSELYLLFSAGVHPSLQGGVAEMVMEILTNDPMP